MRQGNVQKCPLSVRIGPPRAYQDSEPFPEKYPYVNSPQLVQLVLTFQIGVTGAAARVLHGFP